MEPFSRRALAVGALYGLLSILFCLPLFARPLGLGIADWDQHLFYYAEVLKNVVEYGQPPFWSPWYCSGNVMWQNPQVALLSPVYLLVAIMPLALAVKVDIVLHYWVGFLGMHWLLTRVVRLAFLPLIVYAAAIFTLAGSVALHLSVGHSTFLSAFYLPWLLYFVYRAFQTGLLRPALAAAAVLALTLYNGGAHIVPMALIAIGLLAVTTAVAARDWRPLAFCLVVGVFGAAYAAPKLLPIVEFVTSDRFDDARTPTPHPDRMTPDMVWRAYTDSSLRPDSRFAATQRHDWWEYGNYIGTLGVIALGLGLLSPVVMRRMGGRPLAAGVALMAVSFLTLSAGEFHPWAPALALARLPWLSAFRIPSRYTIAFVLFGALAIGAAGRHAVDGWLTTRRRRYSLAALCVIGVASLMFVNRRPFANTFSQPPLNARFSFLGGSNALERDAAVDPYAPNAPMLRAVMSNRGVHYCDEPLQLIRGADIARPLVWSEDSASISDIVFTPNRLQFSVVGGFSPSKIFLNQNYAPGWRSTAGPVLLDPSAGGKMYVQLPAGQTGTFAFSFVPPGLGTGILLLVLAGVASVLVWNRSLSPVTITQWLQPRADVATVPFADRAEYATKMFILSSVAGAVAIRAYVAPGHQTDFSMIAAGSFAIAWALRARWDSAPGLVLGATFVAPAVFSSIWVHDPNAYPLFLTTGLIGAMWRRWSWRRWSLPKAWRVPLVGWALTAAVGWPILALREVDFHPELPGMLDLPASAIGLSARSSIAIVTDSAMLLMLGILWFDWLFLQYASDRERFRRQLVMPLLVGGTVASAVAVYQLFGDITFLNGGWALFRRAGATMMDANGFGIAAVLCGCGFLACLDRNTARQWNTLMLGGFALSLIGTWASGSKTALFAEMVALAFVARSLMRPALSSGPAGSQHRGRLGILALAAAAAALLLFALRNTGPALRIGWILPGTSVESIARFTQMLWDRGGYGKAAVEMIRSHPWFGVGVGSFPLIAGDYPFSHLGGPLAPDNAQNWIRHNLAELGMVGSLGWIAWAAAVAVAIFRGSARTHDRSTTIVAGALVGILLVSQVGMPTQNAAVAIAFWTFLFWFLSNQLPTTATGGESVAAWQWIALLVAILVFGAGTLQTSLTTLRVPMRARHGGWNYVYGFHEGEQTASGEQYRRTDQEAVAVVRSPSRAVKLAVWVTRPDVTSHPVLARVWHEQTLVIDTVLHDNRPVYTDVILDRDPQMLMIRTYLDRTLAESPPDLGLAVQWTFVNAPRTDPGNPSR